MRTALAITLLLFSLAATGQDTLATRFVLGATLSDGASLTDSTFTVNVTTRTDQSGANYRANGIQAGMQILTNTRRMYRVLSIQTAGFSTASLTVKELEDYFGNPSGVAVIYETNAAGTIPTVAQNNQGISAAHLALITSHNANVANNGAGGTTQIFGPYRTMAEAQADGVPEGSLIYTAPGGTHYPADIIIRTNYQP